MDGHLHAEASLRPASCQKCCLTSADGAIPQAIDLLLAILNLMFLLNLILFVGVLCCVIHFGIFLLPAIQIGLLFVVLDTSNSTFWHIKARINWLIKYLSFDA